MSARQRPKAPELQAMERLFATPAGKRLLAPGLLTSPRRDALYLRNRIEAAIWWGIEWGRKHPKREGK